MVKMDVEKNISEGDGDVPALNDNGKRPLEDQNKDGKKRLKTKSLYRQPTAKELNRLQETENLFNSNLFRLQVEEVLQEVKVKEKTDKKFQQWFTELKTHLLSIPEDDTQYDLSENTLTKKLKVKLPIPEECSKTKCVFKFNKFKDVSIVGSYDLGCAISSKLKVDLQITVPVETYTKNDSINYRYHKKHAAYLAYIASHLTKLESIEDLSYSWLNGCETKPVMDFKPTGKLGNHLTVRLNLVCEEDAYKLHRFSPTRNNLRESWLFDGTPENANDVGPPTPYYNSSILQDLTALENERFLKEVLGTSDNLKQAISLLKIWLRQRNLPITGHIVNSIVAYYVQSKRINNIMSSYQIVRNIWIALKTSEWDTKGISLHKGDNTPPLEEFQKHFPVVFLDNTGYYNMCWQMQRGTYSALKRECSLAVDMLDNGTINSFTPLFMTPVKVLTQFDYVLRFKNQSQLKESVLSKVSKEAKLNYGLDRLALVTDSIHTMLVKGLGSRVELVLPLVEADFTWPVKKNPGKVKNEGYEEKLSFGFILNAENCINIIEKGPPANLPEAEQFRSFWGDKSELRRFQDGSITETCVWEGHTMLERRTILTQIIDYLINYKFGLPQSQIFHIGCQLDSLLLSKRHASDVEEGSLTALRAFDELRRDLRLLTELPLDISAVYGVSPVFSYSSPLPPTVRPPPRNPRRKGSAAVIKHIQKDDGTYTIPEYMPVCQAVLELGHSGKWPGDLQAFRCLKAAFNLQIADRLTKQYSLPTQPYRTHIDVLKNGLVFRLVIAHPKELTLVKREVEGGVVKMRDSGESVTLQRDTVLLPRLRGALHGLHQNNPAFGPTACLFKRWLSCHLLSAPHFPDTVADLLTAYVFTRPEPHSTPTMPTAGFLRVLRLIVNTDWTRDVLVLQFHEDMSRAEILEMERKISSGESQPPIRLVTAYDGPLPGVWARDAPSLNTLARVRTLARSTLDYVEKRLDTMDDNLLGAFIPSLSGYDALIHLQAAVVPHSSERVHCSPQRRPLPETLLHDHIPVVEFHPVVKYLDDLRSAYEEYALFFHDLYGGEVIAVLWKPDINDPRELQISNANALTPVTINGERKYKVNTAALIQDFKLLGNGLVRDITVT